LSSETIRKYESGRRNPRREHLESLLRVLDVPQADANEILGGAGFSHPRTLFPSERFPGYFFSVYELHGYVNQVSWPEFVTNNYAELIAANRAAQDFWGIDLEKERTRRTRAQMNLLSVAAEQKFAQRVLNWDECVRTLVSVFKGLPQGEESIESPGAYFEEVLGEFARIEPSLVTRLLSLWTETPASSPKVRWTYKVIWDAGSLDLLNFHCIVTTASEPDGLAFNDWIPVDATTWSALEELKAVNAFAKKEA
jgi:transcriptional regulator with XRE-family HTH domain